MTELLALASAATFGIGDFFGGFASRRADPVRVTALAQVASVAVLVPLVLMVPAPQVTGVDMAWGAGGGLFGMIGVLGLYIGLGRGPMGVVAPITAVLSAVVPVGFGLATGERPAGLAYVGIVLGIVAIAVVSRGHAESGAVPRSAILSALVGGVGFGLFFIFLAQTHVDSGMWPLVGSRAVSIPVAAALAAVTTGGFRPEAAGFRFAVAAGLVDMTANGFFVAAGQRGLVSIASVLAALYPVGTVLLARIVLGERLARHQLVGVAVGVAAVAAIGAA
ncbi:MAG TPA: DMT family transporter [Acidimicrobiia bacterium]|jgi:drug/metabolite transporter (DMT)-like permease